MSYVPIATVLTLVAHDPSHLWLSQVVNGIWPLIHYQALSFGLVSPNRKDLQTKENLCFQMHRWCDCDNAVHSLCFRKEPKWCPTTVRSISSSSKSPPSSPHSSSWSRRSGPSRRILRPHRRSGESCSRASRLLTLNFLSIISVQVHINSSWVFSRYLTRKPDWESFAWILCRGGTNNTKINLNNLQVAGRIY